MCRSIQTATCLSGHRRVLKFSESSVGDNAELTILSLLHHPHIIPVLDSFDCEKGSCIVLPYCKDDANWHPRDRKELWCFVRQLLSAVAHCHQKGVWHHDIKRSNVLFDSDTKTATLIDFGDSVWSRLCDRPSGQGTPTLLFSSPESLIPGGEVGPESDMWAVGVMLLGLVCKSHPFVGAESPSQLATMQSSFDVDRFVESINPELRDSLVETLIRRCLDFDRARRITALNALHIICGRSEQPPPVKPSLVQGMSGSDFVRSLKDHQNRLDKIVLSALTEADPSVDSESVKQDDASASDAEATDMLNEEEFVIVPTSPVPPTLEGSWLQTLTQMVSSFWSTLWR